MAKYVDGFVLVVPKKKVGAYRKMALFGKKLWMRHGALAYMECRGDDLTPPGMDGKKQASYFLTMTKLKASETVWFSFIVFKSKKHRDLVNARVMKDPAMNDPKLLLQSMPMDMKRFAYAGFKVEVGA